MNEELQISPAEEREASPERPLPIASVLSSPQAPPPKAIPAGIDPTASPVDSSAAVATQPPWFRIAYALVFFLALLAGTEAWAQIGGQGHMDLVPWFLKGGCLFLFAWSTVRFTRAMVRGQYAWNLHSRAWFLLIVLTVVTMWGITFWYHLHEATDESDSEDSSTTSVRMKRELPSAVVYAPRTVR